MTDNEIIKALECCTVGTFACGKECPYYSSKSNLKVSSCRFELMCEISDLINRQKAEVERLQKENEVMKTNCNSMCMSMPNMAKAERAEAIKEFAERLKHFIIPQKADGYTREIVLKRDIDNLVKEMTEVEE